MARFHVHVAVHDLQDSIRFYSSLFGREPSVEQPDYAKWLLDDPKLNFAVSARGHAPGVNHLGFQAETPEEFERFRTLARTMETADADEARCCYARSEKYWIADPQGIAWEHFLTLESIPVFGADTPAADGACCIPLKTEENDGGAASCCVPTRSGTTCC